VDQGSVCGVSAAFAGILRVTAMSASEQIVLAIMIAAFPFFAIAFAYGSWPGRRIGRKSISRK
jgi:hypothetical protein